MHIPANSWAPPMTSAQIVPSAFDLTDAKYATTYDPTTAYNDIYYAGHYIKVFWYQPKMAANYPVVSRYGLGNYIGAFCIYGADTTSYFIPPAEA